MSEKKLIIMTHKETKRYDVIKNLIAKKINDTDASKQLELSVRQIKIALRDKYLDYFELPERLKNEIEIKLSALVKTKSINWIPPANHPWRTQYFNNKKTVCKNDCKLDKIGNKLESMTFLFSLYKIFFLMNKFTHILEFK